MLEVGERLQEGTDSGEEEATPRWRMGLTPFSQVLVQIPNQAEGNQACGTAGAITTFVLLLQSGPKLCPQLPGQLLSLQLPAGGQSMHQPLSREQVRGHV